MRPSLLLSLGVGWLGLACPGRHPVTPTLPPTAPHEPPKPPHFLNLNARVDYRIGGRGALARQAFASRVAFLRAAALAPLPNYLMRR